MKIRIKSYKNYTIAATVLSAIFLFPSWFSLSVPMLDSFLEAGSVQISFFNLPSFLEENALLTHITNMAGKSAALSVLIFSAILKYLCVLSAGLALYGVWKSCIKKRPSRFILSSQIIALSLSFISILIVVSFMVIMNYYAESISEVSGISTRFLDISFMPTVWFYLSLASSVCSLIFSGKYRRETE